MSTDKCLFLRNCLCVVNSISHLCFDSHAPVPALVSTSAVSFSGSSGGGKDSEGHAFPFTATEQTQYLDSPPPHPEPSLLY